jgi:hypothetical protein
MKEERKTRSPDLLILVILELDASKRAEVSWGISLPKGVGGLGREGRVVR